MAAGDDEGPLTLSMLDDRLLAIVNLLVWVRVLQYYSTGRNVGVLILMIIKMVDDMKVWIMLSIVFMAAFTVTFAAITHDGVDIADTLTAPAWAMYGEFDLEFTKLSSGVLGQMVLWVYVMVSNILLVNLLIAMMSDTYQEVKEQADLEWKYSSVNSVLEMITRMHPIPPPFSLPVLALRLAWYLVFGLRTLKSLGAGANASRLTEEHQGAEERAWSPGGRLYRLKRRRERVAKLTLQHYRRAQDEAADKSNEGRLQRIEKLVEHVLIFAEDQERELQWLKNEVIEGNEEDRLARGTKKSTIRKMRRGSSVDASAAPPSA